MKFQQIFYPSIGHNITRYRFCKHYNNSVIDNTGESWTPFHPSHNIFNSFYLEIVC